MTAQSQFEAAVREDFEPSRHHPFFPVWLDYALTANARGEALLGSLGEWLPKLEGGRHLDIGSGYGGACVAAAKRGARAIGLELDERLLGFARANQRDHQSLQLEFRKADVLDRSLIEALGVFELVTCDNVIEHVRFPEKLVAHFRLLVAPGGVAYVTIPNAFSVAQIRKECHYGQFGLSLLDPLDGLDFVNAAGVGNPGYDVSDYFRYECYEAMFARHGLSLRLLPEGGLPSVEAVFADAQRLLIELQTAAVPPALKPKVKRRLESHLARFESDLARWRSLEGRAREALGRELVRDYATEVWRVVLVRAEDDVVDRAVRSGEWVARKLEGGLRRLKR